MSEIATVKEICRAPSISVGVLHHGEVVFRKSLGLRDVAANLEADSNTSYLVGSCSKLFTATAVGMLVGDELAWDDCISKHLPDFDPKGDPDIRSQATIADAGHHSTGLANPNAVFTGPGGVLNLKGEDHIAFVNAIPTSNESGQRFNRMWNYSNVVFGLLADVIAASSKMPFASFLRDRLCGPLGLSQTLLSEADVRDNANIAHAYVQRDDGDWCRINHSYTTDTYGAILASMGMRTSVNDMLAFLAAVMSRYDEERNRQPPMELLPQSTRNPLKNISSMWNRWWSRPWDDGFNNNTVYTPGWFRTTVPTSALGMTAYNPVHRREDIIGKESKPRTVYGHSGVLSGSVATAYVIPGSRSAVVAFSNGTDGDAAETASQILLQALFDLKPAVDLLPSAKASVAKRREMHEDVVKEWRERMNVALYDASPEELQGTYLGLGISRIHIVPSDSAVSGLAVTFTDAAEVQTDLEPYNQDSLTFQPVDYCDRFEKCMIDWDSWSVGVFNFVREAEESTSQPGGGKGPFVGLRWQYDELDRPGFWVKLSDGMSDDEVAAIAKAYD